MNDKNNLKYPIKYAVMPIFEQTGWNRFFELEKKYDIVANIVMKCYLLREIKTYFNDETNETKYEVVFLYNNENKNYPDKFEATTPKYDLSSDQYINSIFVQQIYDNFEEALIVANQENDRVLDQKILKTIPFDENLKKNIEKISEEHQKKVDNYKKIESIIEQKTADIGITKFENHQILNKKQKVLIKKV